MASGSAMLTGRGALSVKLGYRYGESQSVCEFLVNGEVSQTWLLPNSIQTWFDWSGIALQNPNASATDALIHAYKAGAEVRNATITIGPQQKWVALLRQSLNRCILAEYHGSGNPGSHGLSIYFPLLGLSYQSQYSDPKYGLDFAADTKWDEFVKYYKGILY